MKASYEEYDIRALSFVSLPGCTWQVGMKYTNIRLQTNQDKDVLLSFENTFREGISSIFRGRYVKSENIRKK